MTGRLRRATRCYQADAGDQILDQTAVAGEPAATGHADLAPKPQMSIAS